MFAKFQLSTHLERLAAWGGFSAETPLNRKLSGKLYDHQCFPVLRVSPHTGKRQMSWMREGLIPSYAHDDHGAPERGEARAEAYTTSAAFRFAFGRRRCIIPADIFNECQHQQIALPVPCSFASDNGEVFGNAGIWESWVDNAGEEILSFAIVTGHVAPALEAVFDRMQIVISEENQERWLISVGVDDLPLELLQTLSKEGLKSWKLMPCDKLLEPRFVRAPRADEHRSHAEKSCSQQY